MAASVNNIAATFASALSSSEHHHSPATSSALSIVSSSATAAASVRPIFASWNPHSSLPLSSCSSLLSLYGPPGPLRRPLLRRRHSPRLPNITLSCLDDADTPRSVSLSSLSPPGRRSVLLSVPGAFLSPRRRPRPFSAESLVRRAGDLRRRGAGAVGIVSANDVFVMRAWGEALGAAEGGVAMLSDPDAALARAVGMAADFTGGPEGLVGVRSEGFCLVAEDGAVRALFADGAGGFDDVIRAL
ncbi:putative basic proline-rich protein-like [Iris pallida]|uniref:glutaredoxin-dependent peroxiredoxin n=1 Tax=Iris pallida TaxID=29817 RepID=A0AAX6E5Y1_IRIPA|nr:putative basic proline-rich protein-like [Iris pallida]